MRRFVVADKGNQKRLRDAGLRRTSVVEDFGQHGIRIIVGLILELALDSGLKNPALALKLYRTTASRSGGESAVGKAMRPANGYAGRAIILLQRNVASFIHQQTGFCFHACKQGSKRFGFNHGHLRIGLAEHAIGRSRRHLRLNQLGLDVRLHADLPLLDGNESVHQSRIRHEYAVMEIGGR